MHESQNAIENQLHALWLQSLQGNSASYERVLTLLSGHLRRFLRKRLPHPSSDVEDLVQETLIAVHERRDTWRRGEPLTNSGHPIPSLAPVITMVLLIPSPSSSQV